MSKVHINNTEYEFTRPKLKKWLELEDKHVLLHQAISLRDNVGIAKHICSIIAQSLGITEEEIQDRPWYELGSTLFVIEQNNRPRYEFPLLNTTIQDKKEAWDYSGRTWYIWAYMLTEKTGWSLEYIAELDVDDAIALAQEIAVDKQLQKEWEWSLSEVPYQTKDGFKSLPRPDWMNKPKNFEVKKVKMRKDFMPYGIIMKWEEDKDENTRT